MFYGTEWPIFVLMCR